MRWHDYQEEVAEFFRKLGCDVEVDARVQGARAKHNIDVWVKFHRYGFEIKWAIDCKQHKEPIRLEKASALREIVVDIGADHGVLLAESGFQPGAKDVVKSTNISLRTFEELRELAKPDLLSNILRKLEEKAERLDELMSDLFIPKPPEPWFPEPRPGVDEEGHYAKRGELHRLMEGLKRGRMGRFPAKLLDLDQPQEELKLIIAHNLEELLEKSGRILEKIEKWVKAQEKVIRKLKREP